MRRLSQLVWTSVFGGFVVLLPITILALAFRWLFQVINRLFAPLSALVVQVIPVHPKVQMLIGNIVVLVALTGLCFALGMLAKTRIGSMFQKLVERSVLGRVPGYKLIKETVNQVIGAKKTPFSSVAVVRPWGDHTGATAFITDEHSDGSFTVFVPTAPNPTSGNIFHLPASRVQKVSVPVESAMRSILACGAGSQKLIDKLHRNQDDTDDIGEKGDDKNFD